VPYYLAISDVFIHASHREGFPNVMLEAGAMCCPVICSDIPGNTELAQPMKTALVYPVGQVDALKEAMEFAFVKREVMQGFAENLYQLVRSKYDRKAVHQEILNQYYRLLDNGK
jgi:glycosyltransferase involved in cell wall biosynthesis